ncbi:MAG: hypothetical protein DHS20C01_08550 [marine bacterium B5-7]|nr:MAG: hypothetical protein DHS20C01_08550 [marine bacterium B5-7]
MNLAINTSHPLTYVEGVDRQQTDEPVNDAIIFDEDGFLVETTRWDADLARTIAGQEGIVKLGYEHWKILHFVRDYFEQFGAVPLMRRVCRDNRVRKEEIKRLFASCRSVWRIAGLPHPGEEAKTYMN